LCIDHHCLNFLFIQLTTDSLSLKQTTHYCIAHQTFVFLGNQDIVHLAGEDAGDDGINANLDSGHLFTVCGKRFNKAYAKVDNFLDVAASSRSDEQYSNVWSV
jgi:hypothetical protein